MGLNYGYTSTNITFIVKRMSTRSKRPRLSTAYGKSVVSGGRVVSRRRGPDIGFAFRASIKPEERILRRRVRPRSLQSEILK